MAPMRDESNSLADAIGAFYGGDGLARALGVSTAHLGDLDARGDVLAVTTRDGQVAYPAAQFTRSADGLHVMPGLGDVIRALRSSDVGAWTIALWLVTPLDELADVSAVEWLRRGGDLVVVLTIAQADAARWRR